MEKEQWVGAALVLIGIYFLSSSILGLWAFAMFSSALQMLRQQGFQVSLGPLGGMVFVSFLIVVLSFFTGIVSIVGGALFASKIEVEKLKAVKVPKRVEELYEKLLNAYSSVYGSRGKQKLEKKIEEYVNQGLTRNAAIRKVAEKEGYV